jgi:hypothetical protein
MYKPGMSLEKELDRLFLKSGPWSLAIWEKAKIGTLSKCQ